MLLDFRFKNFQSFGNDCYFTMLAEAADKVHIDRLIKNGNNQISQTRIIYGANASGKTSFMRAMAFVVNYAQVSNFLLEGMPIPVTPFKFRPNAFDTPSEFYLSFIVDGIKYVYEFTCTQKEVLEERLDAYYSSRVTNVFHRTGPSEYKFNSNAKQLKEISEKNLPNKLFLTTAASWNYDKVKPVADFLCNKIIPVEPRGFSLSLLANIIKNGEFDEYKKFCLNLLNNADFSINDFKYTERKANEFFPPELLEVISSFEKVEIGKQVIKDDLRFFDFTMTHEVYKDGASAIYPLNINEESEGTKSFFSIAPMLYNVFKKGLVLFVDELDKSLHPHLVEYIIKLFHNEDVNRNNAQLIANTHDTNLLKLSLLRRDEIWFVDKDRETKSSELFSLADFSARKDENIEKSYLIGRFGAIPCILED